MKIGKLNLTMVVVVIVTLVAILMVAAMKWSPGNVDALLVAMTLTITKLFDCVKMLIGSKNEIAP